MSTWLRAPRSSVSPRSDLAGRLGDPPGAALRSTLRLGTLSPNYCRCSKNVGQYGPGDRLPLEFRGIDAGGFAQVFRKRMMAMMANPTAMPADHSSERVIQ